MRNSGIIRFLVCCIAGVAILVYNSVNILGCSEEKNVKYQPLSEITFFDDSFSLQENLQASQTTPNTQITEKTEAAAQVSAGAVKGNVISKYISPYNVALSYDGIYVKNNTSLSPNLKKLLSQDLKFKITQTNDPQVLIMHTHTTETFMPSDSNVYTENFESRTTDNSRNMARIGEIVAERLNGAGIVTLHDKTQHDYPEYTGSYTRAAKTINSYLKKYPSIKIVLDLHRDAVSSGESDKVKLVTKIGGKKAAQVMLVMGSQSGGVTNYPNWQENFKLAIRLQQRMEKMYPTLARPLMLMSKNYNQSLSNGSLLIEFGTDANSLEEVHYSATLVSDALVSLLSDLR